MDKFTTSYNVQPTADTFSVDTLVRYVLSGQVRVPKFQRGLRWEAKDVVDLFDSIYRGYPIGSFLLSKGEGDEEDVSIGKLEINAPKTSSSFWVIDGQQRITAITTALIQLYTRPAEPGDPWVVYFDAKARTFNSYPQNGQIPTSWIPVAELLDAAKLSEWVFNWEEAKDPEIRSAVFDAGARIRQYQIPVYIVDTNDEKFIREIFYRINNFGKSLKWGEIHDAIFGDTENNLTTLSDLSNEIEHLGMGRLEESQLLNCLIAFRGLDVTRTFVEHYRKNNEVLRNAVQEALPSIKRVLAFFQNSAEIPHLRLLPRFTPLPILTRFFTLHPNPNQRTIVLLARWMWRLLICTPIIDERTLLRRAISEINEDEEASVQILLNLVPNHKPPVFNLPAQFDARSAVNRIFLAGLCSIHPIDFYSGEPIDIAGLIEAYDVGAFRKIVSVEHILKRSPANRILFEGSGYAKKDLLEYFENSFDSKDIQSFQAILEYFENSFVNQEVWSSHAISEVALQELISNNLVNFLQERKSTIEKIINQFSDRVTGWNSSDRPSIKYLLSKE